jgi:hypothetical protein
MLTKTHLAKLAVLAMICSLATAQPHRDRLPPEQQQAEQEAQANPDTLRKRLLQTLNFAKRIVEKHEAALAQLDAGEDPREVIRALRSPESRQGKQQGKRLHAQALGREDSAQAPHSPPPMLTKQELKEVRAFIAEHLLDVVALKQVEAISPDSTERLLGRLAPKVLEILRLQNDNSALSSLKLDELKAGLFYVEAARHYRGLLRTGSQDQAAIEQAEQQVRQAASDRFDAQVHIKQYEIHQLTMRIEQLHDALEVLNTQRDNQVDAQVNAARRTPGPRFERLPNQQQSDPQSGNTATQQPADGSGDD